MDLEKRKQEIEQAFQQLKQRREAMARQIQEIEIEQVRLQGEYRLVESLLKKDEPAPQGQKKK